MSATAEPSLRVVTEKTLGHRERRQAGRLLAQEWGADWRRNAYAGPQAPQLRVLELNRAGGVIGQVSAFWLPTEPQRRMYGIGDLVVKPRYRGTGVARRMCEALTAECWRREAEIVLVDTLAAQATFLALGFRVVTAFDYFYEVDDTCRRHRHWLAAERVPVERVCILEHGDF